MTELKSALLNVLPASERNLFQTNTIAPVAKSNTAIKGGVEELKSTLTALSKQLTSFKYNKADNRLYAYYATTEAAKQQLNALFGNPSAIGNLTASRSGSYSIRIDNASAYTKAVELAIPATLGFDDYVRLVKSTFRKTHECPGVGVSFSVYNNRKVVVANASTSSLRTAGFKASSQALAAYQLGISRNVSSGYSASAEFSYEEYKKYQEAPVLEFAPEAAAVAPPTENKLLAGLKTSMASTETFSGVFTSEQIAQFKRIIDGERLPAMPAMAIYDDVAAAKVTQGSAVTLVYRHNGKRVDIEAMLCDLRLNNKTAAVLATEVSKATLFDATVVDPVVIIMRDFEDADTAYMVLNNAKGFHRHITLKKRKQ